MTVPGGVGSVTVPTTSSTDFSKTQRPRSVSRSTSQLVFPTKDSLSGLSLLAPSSLPWKAVLMVRSPPIGLIRVQRSVNLSGA